MPKFIIEREMPQVGKLTDADYQGVAQHSCDVLKEMGPHIQWVESYISEDKVYCVYISPDAETIQQHAANAGFPANQVSLVKTIIDPTTAEAS